MRASAESCDECSASFTLWSQVYQLLSRQGEYEPSAPVLQRVKNAFGNREVAPWWGKLTEFATVVFDSFLTPAPAGVRSGARSSRQITVESGAFVVDLQLESDIVQHKYSLTGQILGGENANEKIVGAEVVLLSPEKVMQKTRANELGEFCLDFNWGENLRLFIDIKGERGVGIMLPALDDARTDLTQ